MSQIIEAAKCHEKACMISPTNAHPNNIRGTPCLGPKCAHWEPAYRLEPRNEPSQFIRQDQHAEGYTPHGRCGLSSK